MKRFLTSLFLLIFFVPLWSQEQESAPEKDITIGVDLVNRYVWRGLLFCSTPSMQPYVSYTKGGFTLGSWASYTNLDNYSEVDFYATYAMGPIALSLWDYWSTLDENGDYKYFNFKPKETSHMVEASAVFTGPEAFPLNVTLAGFFYGCDRNENNTSNNYSTYFELAYPFTWKENNLSVFMGMTPKEGLYANNDFAVNNIGISSSRSIEITEKFSIPLKVTLALNPDVERIFFVIAATF